MFYCAAMQGEIKILILHVSGCCCFYDINISQGSVATRLTCGGIFYYRFATYLLLNSLIA